MYKNMKAFLILVAVMAIIIVSAFTYISNRYMYKEFKDEFRNIKEELIEFYFEENFKDLEDLLNGHAVWTDTLKAIKIGDFDWLDENATAYLLDEENLNVDYIFITDESGIRKKSYGTMTIEAIDTHQVYNLAIDENRNSREVIWYNDEPIILSGGPIVDNDYNNPNGCFIIGRKISTDELSNLKKLLSSKYVKEIQFSKSKINDQALALNLVPSRYVLDEDNLVYLDTVFSIEYFSLIYNGSIFMTIGIIILVAMVAVTILTINIKRLSSKLVEIIITVKQISSGEYHVKLVDNKSKMMPEVSELVESINIMSSDIEDNIAKVQQHSNVIDQQYTSMIELLVDTVEMNDSYTYHHSVSVAKYALIIGKAVEFENLKDLELAAQLHDVGKISISTEILNKPGKLTNEEFDVIKTHSLNGYKLLNKIEKFKIARHGVLHHHEKYDGTGYPDGLKGDAIPMIAQIITVADMYDALTSDRAYRNEMDCHDAMDILFDEKGKTLNPVLVDIFYEEMKALNCSDNS